MNRLFFRPEQCGLTKTDAAAQTLSQCAKWGGGVQGRRSCGAWEHHGSTAAPCPMRATGGDLRPLTLSPGSRRTS